MNNYQFIILFQCLILFAASCGSKNSRRLRTKEKKPAKTCLNKTSQDRTNKLDSTGNNNQDRSQNDNNRSEVLGYTDMLNSIDSLKDKNDALSEALDDCSNSHYGVPSDVDFLWSKFMEEHKVEDNQAKKVVYNSKTFDTYIVNVASSELQFYWRDDKEAPIKSLKHLSKIVERDSNHLIFGTNGGMYTPSNAPQGLFIQDGKVLRKIDRRKNEYGNFYMQPNGIFLIDTNNTARIIPTHQYKDEVSKSAKFATQSGPMAVINGKVNKKFKKNSRHLNIRSGVGIIDSAHVVFVISNKRVSFYDFASVFKENFHCDNALYLDGAISEMYLPELRRFQYGGNFGPMIGVTKKH